MQLSIDQALAKAIEAHRAGKLQDAEALYRTILQTQPRHPDANHNLGVIAVSLDKVSIALPFFKIALEADPRQGQFWVSYVDALIKQGQLETAKRTLAHGLEQGLSGPSIDELTKRLEAKLHDQKPVFRKIKKGPFTAVKRQVKSTQEQEEGLLIVSRDDFCEKPPRSGK